LDKKTYRYIRTLRYSLSSFLMLLNNSNL